MAPAFGRDDQDSPHDHRNSEILQKAESLPQKPEGEDHRKDRAGPLQGRGPGDADALDAEKIKDHVEDGIPQTRQEEPARSHGVHLRKPSRDDDQNGQNQTLNHSLFASWVTTVFLLQAKPLRARW